jgi:hypothetical protein
MRILAKIACGVKELLNHANEFFEIFDEATMFKTTSFVIGSTEN